MSTPDAPDWERVVVSVQAAGDVPDAPDWERIVVSPGGAPVGGGATSNWEPTDYGWAAWTFAPPLGTASTNLGSGTVYFSQVKFAKSASISHAVLAGYGAYSPVYIADQNFVGLYEPSYSGGTLVGLDLMVSSAAGALDTVLGTLGTTYGGVVTFDMGVSYSVSASAQLYAAVLVNTSGPGSYMLSYHNNPWPFGGVGVNYIVYPPGITAPSFYSTLNLTALPASISASDLVAEGTSYWQAFY